SESVPVPTDTLFSAAAPEVVADTAVPLAELSPSEPKLFPALPSVISPAAPAPVEVNDASPGTTNAPPSVIAPPEVAVSVPFAPSVSADRFNADKSFTATLSRFPLLATKLTPPLKLFPALPSVIESPP